MTVSAAATTGVTPTSATSARAPARARSSSSSSTTSSVSIADNFSTFLTLLTTQLKNQNPLDPLDTNQFTQQLVQFAQVEQQMKGNDQLKTLVSLQQSAQATTALNYVGSTVVVDGSTSKLANGKATWNLTSSKPATGSVVITDSTGQTVYTGTVAINSGTQSFTWDGHSTNGVQRPDGNYTISVTATDASKQPVTVTTEAQGTVGSVDLTQTRRSYRSTGRTTPSTRSSASSARRRKPPPAWAARPQGPALRGPNGDFFAPSTPRKCRGNSYNTEAGKRLALSARGPHDPFVTKRLAARRQSAFCYPVVLSQILSRAG